MTAWLLSFFLKLQSQGIQRWGSGRMAQFYLWEILEWNVKKSASRLLRQRWSSTTFSLLLALLVWTSSTYSHLAAPIFFPCGNSTMYTVGICKKILYICFLLVQMVIFTYSTWSPDMYTVHANLYILLPSLWRAWRTTYIYGLWVTKTDTRPFWAISSWTAAFFLRWNSWTAFLVEGSGHKLESSQARVFHPHFSVAEGIVNRMEQKTQVFCQTDIQEFHLWRRKGQGHLSPFVILKLFSRRRKGKGHLTSCYTGIISWRWRWKTLADFFGNLQHCCSNVL